MVDPEIIPNADQHLREYQAPQPPRTAYRARSQGLFATGTAKLIMGIQNTAGKQRDTNVSGILVPGLGRNLRSSSTALANEIETIPSAFAAPKTKGKNYRLNPAIIVFSGRNPTGTAERMRQRRRNVQ